MKNPRKRPEKAYTTTDLTRIVRESVAAGRYRPSKHAFERMQERQVTIDEIRQVLETGHHKPAKDAYDEEEMEWNYAFEGKTTDDRSLRIPVAIKADGTLVVTVIDLKKKATLH